MGAIVNKPREQYDRQADVLYVMFGDDEPAYTENIDDCLMLEIGWFSGLPKGFRIIGLKARNIKGVEVRILRKINNRVQKMMGKRAREIEQQEPAVRKLFEQKLPGILDNIVARQATKARS